MRLFCVFFLLIFMFPLKTEANDPFVTIENLTQEIKTTSKKNKSQYYLFRARQYIRIFDYNSAINDFSHSLELNPSQGTTHLERAKAYFEIKEYGKAKQDIEKICLLFPGLQPQTIKLSIQVNSAQGKIEKIIVQGQGENAYHKINIHRINVANNHSSKKLNNKGYTKIIRTEKKFLRNKYEDEDIQCAAQQKGYRNCWLQAEEEYRYALKMLKQNPNFYFTHIKPELFKNNSGQRAPNVPKAPVKKLTYLDGEKDARRGNSPKSHRGSYYAGYQDEKQRSKQPASINGEWDTNGQHYTPAGGGNAWRQDGTFMQKAAGGYIDTKTGQFVPSTN